MQNRMSRRQMMKLSAGALLAAGLWPGALGAKDGAADDFSFIVINDLHFTDAKCAPYFEALVKQLKAADPKPDFCLLAGDLSENGTLQQLAAIADIFKPLGIAVKAVPGNHDWVKKDERMPYLQAWPDSLNYTFEHRGWQIVALDSTEGQEPNATVQKPSLDFLDNAMAKLDHDRPTILFTHMPLGMWVRSRVKNANDVLERLKNHNLRAVFCGHFHGSTSRPLGAITITTNRCCSFRRQNHDKSKEKGYFLCRAAGGKVERKFVEFQFGEPTTQPS